MRSQVSSQVGRGSAVLPRFRPRVTSCAGVERFQKGHRQLSARGILTPEQKIAIRSQHLIQKVPIRRFSGSPECEPESIPAFETTVFPDAQQILRTSAVGLLCTPVSVDESAYFNGTRSNAVTDPFQVPHLQEMVQCGLQTLPDLLARPREAERPRCLLNQTFAVD